MASKSSFCCRTNKLILFHVIHGNGAMKSLTEKLCVTVELSWKLVHRTQSEYAFGKLISFLNKLLAHPDNQVLGGKSEIKCRIETLYYIIMDVTYPDFFSLKILLQPTTLTLYLTLKVWVV